MTDEPSIKLDIDSRHSKEIRRRLSWLEERVFEIMEKLKMVDKPRRKRRKSVDKT